MAAKFRKSPKDDAQQTGDAVIHPRGSTVSPH